MQVVAPLAGGPSERAGVRAGDVIPSIDGKPTRGLSLYEVSDLLRGPVSAHVHAHAGGGGGGGASHSTARHGMQHAISMGGPLRAGSAQHASGYACVHAKVASLGAAGGRPQVWQALHIPCRGQLTANVVSCICTPMLSCSRPGQARPFRPDHRTGQDAAMPGVLLCPAA